MLFLFSFLFSAQTKAQPKANYTVWIEEVSGLRPDSAAVELRNFLKSYPHEDAVKCQALIAAGRVSTRVSDYVLAEHYAKQAVELSKTTDHTLVPVALRQLAKVYQATNRFTEAQVLLQKALSILQKQNNYHEALNTKIDLIEFYRSAADPYIAWQLYQDLKPDLMGGKLTPAQAARLLHRAAACAAEGKINDSVVHLSLQSLEISKKHNFYDHMATSYNELGFYYNSKKQYSLAIEYLHKAEEVFQKIGHKQDQIIVLRNQVILYTGMGRLNKAEKVLARLSNFPQRPALYKNSYDYWLLHGNLWKARGDFKKAYGALDSARRLQADANWQMHNRQIDELTTKYRTALAEQRALEKNQLAIRASEKALQNRIERNTAFIGGGIILFIAVLLAFAYRNNRKKRALVELHNSAIDQVNKLLSDSLAVQESLYNELHHRVKNNLAVLSSLLYLQSRNASGSVKQALSQTRSRVEALALLHRHLIGESQLQGNICLSDYLDSLFHHLKASLGYADQKIYFTLDCENLMLPPPIVTSIGLALNELITNSYKHAFTRQPAGKIFLRCHKEGQILIVLYSDNGTGIPDTTDDGQKKSLGLTIIKLLVKQHKGSYRYYRERSLSCFELKFTLKLTPATQHETQTVDYRR